MEAKAGRAQRYQIKIAGKLNRRWAEWFDGLSIDCNAEDNGAIVTTLTGPIADQAALHGLFMRIRELNLRLISVVDMDYREASSNG